jgi:tRNA threonylcarbamoyladenosine biosynthesis protein TsaB
VVPISTLAALAQRHHRESGAVRILPAFDARMHEVYWGAYRLGADGLVELLGQESVSPPEQVELPPGNGWQGVGSGWLSYEELLRQRLGEALEAVHTRQLCHARDIAQLAVKGVAAGAAVSAEQALPVYLRNQVANKPRSG